MDDAEQTSEELRRGTEGKKHRLETRKEETEFVAELMIEIEDI